MKSLRLFSKRISSSTVYNYVLVKVFLRNDTKYCRTGYILLDIIQTRIIFLLFKKQADRQEFYHFHVRHSSTYCENSSAALRHASDFQRGNVTVCHVLLFNNKILYLF